MNLKKYAFLFVLAAMTAMNGYAQNDTTATFKVSGVCGMCKMRIEKALKIKGVSSAKWNVSTQMLTVKYNPQVIQLIDIHSKMAEVGHDTELKKAKNEVYKALPECCHYRDGAHSDDEATTDENTINGMVVSEDKKGNFSPLAGASVYWLGTSKGVTTNEHGIFSLQFQTGKLVVSYTGFRTDTLSVADNNDLQIVMAPTNSLKEVTVTTRQKNTLVSLYSPIRVSTITSRELLKAACCNLSESFETNPSVDVSYSDAVTGSKQIQLLGLSGVYTQLTVENLPGPRGIATPLGLNSIAGPWVESIQLVKGTGSVANGFESIAGQINIELKKPESMERLYANGYVNSMGKTDFNLNLSQKVGSKWATAFLLHDDFLFNKTDQNGDGFRDLPTGNQFSAINRWKFDNGKGFMFQLGAKALLDDKTGGELEFKESAHKGTTQYYGLGIKTNRYEGFAKIGYVFPGKKFKSVGLQLSAFDHDHQSYFGLSTYNARQKNFYVNLIFQDIIGTTDHKYRAGISFSADDYDELMKGLSFKRKEIVPGAFVEYTYTMNEKFSVVAGLRGDYNNLFGWFATPRINARYEPFRGTSLRMSIGRGQKTANIFAENIGAFVSARTIQVLGNSDKGYGLDPEVAWNKGISIDQKLKLFGKDALLSVDFFRNNFTNQVVVDMEDPKYLKFYNLQGKSYSNSFQAELTVTPVNKLDIRVAYRWFDVKDTYNGKLLSKPFTAQHRAFANLAYELKDWKFDYTFNFTGSKRIPSTVGHDPAHQLPIASPSYITMNAQVSKAFEKSKAFELYVGGENLTNYMQEISILSADQPFSNQFDASMIWGPISGRLIYGGFRFRIK